MLEEHVYYIDTNINHNRTRLLHRTCYDDDIRNKDECANGAPEGWPIAKEISNIVHTPGIEGWSEYQCGPMNDPSKSNEKYKCTY